LNSIKAEDRIIRVNATETLLNIDKGNKEAIDVLMKALHEEKSDSRKRAAEILGNQDLKNNKEALNELAQSLNDTDVLVRKQVIDSLW